MRRLFALALFGAALACGSDTYAQYIQIYAGGAKGKPFTLASTNPLFVLNPANASTLTIATGVSRATDDAGGSQVLTQPTAGYQVPVDSTRTLGKGAYPSLAFNGHSLSSATGGVTGSADHSICVVGAADSLSTFDPWAIMGAPTGASGSTSTLGTVYLSPTPQWWAARGSGPGTPNSAAPFAADEYPHLLCLVFASQTISLWVDGVEAISAVSDTGYNLPGGFGINAFYPGYTTIAHIWLAGWWTRALDAKTLGEIGKFVGSRYQIGGTVVSFGDSLAYGYPGSPVNAIPAFLNADYLTRPVQSLNFGIAGQRTDQILARTSSITGLTSTANGMPVVAILDGGINDAYQGLSAVIQWNAGRMNPPTIVSNVGNLYLNDASCTTGSTAPTCTSGTCSDGGCTWKYVSANTIFAFEAWSLGNMRAAATALRAVGVKVLVLPMTPVGRGTFAPASLPSVATFAAALNADIAAGVGAWNDGVIPALSAPELATPYSCWTNSDNVHPTTTAACTCPLSGLGSWATSTAYTVPLMVKNAGVYYALEASCTSGASAPTCASGSCSDGACTWDAIPAGADCSVSGYQALARTAAPQVKPLLGM